MARKKHPKPEVDEALRYAEQYGWKVKVGGSHAWGRMYCPYNDQDCRCGEFCIASVEHPQKRHEPCPANQEGG